MRLMHTGYTGRSVDSAPQQFYFALQQATCFQEENSMDLQTQNKIVAQAELDRAQLVKAFFARLFSRGSKPMGLARA